MTVVVRPDLPAAGDDRDDAARAARGDTSAFERLYRRHAGRVNALACRMSGREDADDLVQDVFVRCWEKLHLFRGESRFGTWLHRLAVNVVLQRMRGEKRREKRVEFTDDLRPFDHGGGRDRDPARDHHPAPGAVVPPVPLRRLRHRRGVGLRRRPAPSRKSSPTTRPT